MQSIAISPIQFDPFTPAKYEGAPHFKITAIIIGNSGEMMRNPSTIRRVIAEMAAGIYKGQAAFVTDRNMIIENSQLDGLRKHQDERGALHIVFFGSIIPPPTQRRPRRIGHKPVNLAIGDTFIADYQVLESLPS